jgi:hypothetical protein
MSKFSLCDSRSRTASRSRSQKLQSPPFQSSPLATKQKKSIGRESEAHIMYAFGGRFGPPPRARAPEPLAAVVFVVLPPPPTMAKGYAQGELVSPGCINDCWMNPYSVGVSPYGAPPGPGDSEPCRIGESAGGASLRGRFTRSGF